MNPHFFTALFTLLSFGSWFRVSPSGRCSFDFVRNWISLFQYISFGSIIEV